MFHGNCCGEDRDCASKDGCPPSARPIAGDRLDECCRGHDQTLSDLNGLSWDDCDERVLNAHRELAKCAGNSGNFWAGGTIANVMRTLIAACKNYPSPGSGSPILILTQGGPVIIYPPGN